jgi:hypothetical protein
MKAAEALLFNQNSDEMASVSLMSSLHLTPVATQLFGRAPLRSTLPDLFETLVKKYTEQLERSLQRRLYKIETNISEELRSLAEELGFVRAGPRDVVDIHSTVIKRQSEKLNALKLQASIEEGRLMVLEFMGYLVSYYRNHCMGYRGREIKPHEGEGNE